MDADATKGREDVMMQAREELVVPTCPYCGLPLDGPVVNGLHAACDQRLQEELEEAWGPVGRKA